MKIYQAASVRDGSMYIKGRKVDLTLNLFDGNYLLTYQRMSPNSTVKEYRACYFAKVDIIAGEVGETKNELHKLIKDNLVSAMIEEVPQCFTSLEISTQNLTLEGWIVLLDKVDQWAFITYNIML